MNPLECQAKQYDKIKRLFRILETTFHAKQFTSKKTFCHWVSNLKPYFIIRLEISQIKLVTAKRAHIERPPTVRFHSAW